MDLDDYFLLAKLTGGVRPVIQIGADLPSRPRGREGLAVESVPGQGTTFRIVLPVDKAPKAG